MRGIRANRVEIVVPGHLVSGIIAKISRKAHKIRLGDFTYAAQRRVRCGAMVLYDGVAEGNGIHACQPATYAAASDPFVTKAQ